MVHCPAPGLNSRKMLRYRHVQSQSAIHRLKLYCFKARFTPIRQFSSVHTTHLVRFTPTSRSTASPCRRCEAGRPPSLKYIRERYAFLPPGRQRYCNLSPFGVTSDGPSSFLTKGRGPDWDGTLAIRWSGMRRYQG